MLYRAFGRTGLQISELGLGCASFWGKPSFDEATALALVHEAAAQGVTFFDTGASYSGGHAEPRLGRALASLRGKNDLIISTKAGTRLGLLGRAFKDFSPAWVRQSAEASLGRLGLETLPLFHLHGPQIKDLTDDLLTALQKLKQEGKVRFLSVNSFDVPVIEHVKDLGFFDAVMIDDNILRPQRAPLVAALAAKGLGVLAGMALAGGLYRPVRLSPLGPREVWYALRALKNHRRDLSYGKRFRFIDARPPEAPGLTGAQIALAWVLADKAVSCAVFGTTRPANLREALAASGLALPPALCERIREAQSAL